MRAKEAPLGHESYWTAEAFSQERATLFRRVWLFAGCAADFGPQARPVECSGEAVTIARNGAGWQGFEGGRAIAVETCGTLVFYSLSTAPEPLENYLGSFAGDLREMSSKLGAPAHRDRVLAEANWKILVENTLDDLHPAFVHRETLYLSMQNEEESRCRLDRQGRHSRLEKGLGARDLEFWAKLAGRLPLDRYSGKTGYRHLFIFPNFYISSFYGAMVLLHRVDPLGPETAALDWSLHLPLAEGKESAFHRAILRDQAQKARRVIDEDIAICHAAHKGHAFAPLPALLGAEEMRVLDFQEALMRREGEVARCG